MTCKVVGTAVTSMIVAAVICFEGEAEVNCAAPAPALTAWPFTAHVTIFGAGSVVPAGDTTAVYCT